jgi:outer membrane protein assembly factor BamB
MPGILLIALALLASGASAQEDPQLFTILERSPDFRPLQGFDLVVASNDQLLFMLGSTPDAGGGIDAALVAVDPRSGDADWRVVRGEPGQRDVFTAVATARSLVCASGVRAGAGGDVLLVGCYSVRSGDAIWEKEVASPTGHSPAHVLRAEGRNLLMWIPSPTNPSLLRFDLFDGNP